MNDKTTIVLYIVSMRHGGAERVMSILANSFADRGYNVVLVTDVPVAKNEDNYAISDMVKCVCIEPKSSNYFIKNIKRIKTLRKVVKREKATTVLSFLGKQNFRMLIATFGLRCRKCVSVRNDPNREYGKSCLKRWIANRVFSLADVCIFQTNEAKKYFNKRNQKKSVVISNPIDEKFFNVKRDKNPRNIVTVGRLEPQKNQKLLIDAFSLIADKINDNLLIYGGGSLHRELEEYIDKIGMRDRIVLMGEVENIEKELAKAKIFVLSSDYEGMPNALMEAMAVGVPCISTDCPCGGPRELIEDDVNGLLVCRGDIDLMSKKILWLCNTGCLGTMGDKARQCAKDNRLDEIIPKWVDALMLGTNNQLCK